MTRSGDRPSRPEVVLSEPRAANVFISYSRRDEHFVKKLDAALLSRGRDVWVDWEDIPPTARWRDEVRSAIEASDTIVYVISPDSLASDVCREELDHAATCGKRILPILARDVGACDVPTAAAEHEWISFRNGDGFDGAVDLLIRSLDTDLEWTKEHTRLLVRAIEWDQSGRDGSFLLRGSDLDAAARWLSLASPDKSPQPTELHTRYIIAGQAGETRRRRWRFGAVSVALAVTAMLATVALVQRNDAVSQRQRALSKERLAVSRGLAAQALAQLDERPDVALLLAVEAVHTDDDLDAQTVLLHVLVENERLERVLTAPAGDQLSAVTFSADGRTVFAGTTSGGLVAWDLSTGASSLIRRRGPASVTEAVATDPRGEGVAWLTEDGWILVSDGVSASSRVLGTIDGGGIGGTTAWDASGTQLVVASAGSIYRWALPEGRQVDVRPGAGLPEHGYGSAVLSSDATLIASSEEGGKIGVIDAATGRRIRRLSGGHPPGGVPALSANGRWLASGLSRIDVSSLSGDIRHGVFDAGTAEYVAATALSPDGKVLAVETEDDNERSTLFLVNVLEGALLDRPQAAYAPPASSLVGLDMAFGPRGTSLATIGPMGRSILIWNVLGTRRALSREVTTSSWNLDISADGRFLASAPASRSWSAFRDEGSRLMITDLTTGRRLLRSEAPRITRLAFAPDGRRLAVEQAGRGTVTVWNVTGGGSPRAIVSLPGRFGGWAPDGDTLATADMDGVRLWSAADEVTDGRLHWPGGWDGDGVTFSADGATVAVPGRAGVAIYGVASGTRTRFLQMSRPWFAIVDPGTRPTMTFDPSGRDLVLGTSDDETRLLVWDPATDPPPIPPASRLDDVSSVAYSPDGRFVATAVPGVGIALWDAASGQRIGVLDRLGADRDQRLSFGADSRSLRSMDVIESPDGALRHVVVRWDLDPTSMAATACRIAGRNLTLAEWSRFMPGEPYRQTCELARP